LDPMDKPIVDRRRPPEDREEEQPDLSGEPLVYEQAKVESAPPNRAFEDGPVPAGEEDPRSLADADNWRDRQRQPDDPSQHLPADRENRDPRTRRR